jgi:predicted nucleic acid-binding Zn ribbon protein
MSHCHTTIIIYSYNCNTCRGKAVHSFHCQTVSYDGNTLLNFTILQLGRNEGIYVLICTIEHVSHPDCLHKTECIMSHCHTTIIIYSYNCNTCRGNKQSEQVKEKTTISNYF